jgi:hypothetical protein
VMWLGRLSDSVEELRTRLRNHGIIRD